jgi:hypothetical protein
LAATLPADSDAAAFLRAVTTPERDVVTAAVDCSKLVVASSRSTFRRELGEEVVAHHRARVSGAVGLVLGGVLGRDDTSSLFCRRWAPPDCCTVCATSWASRCMPNASSGWYRPAAKWMSWPTV